jgi:hypothetical protein
MMTTSLTFLTALLRTNPPLSLARTKRGEPDEAYPAIEQWLADEFGGRFRGAESLS